LGHKRVLITFPMQDAAFRPRNILPRMRSALPGAQVVELPQAKHYFVEDSPKEVAAATAKHFG
jgi:pimeloyl-ACP methyl ester carboxylesterase